MTRPTDDKNRPREPDPAIPASLAGLFAEFRGCFSAWTFPVFCALACGLVSQTGRRTVCGMLVGARLSTVWSHHRAHRFFSHGRWTVEAVSVVAARLVVRLLVGATETVTVAVDDTLFARRGPKVHAASWFHDGSAQGKRKVSYGNNWVIVAIVVRLAFLDRPVALPVSFALVRKDTEDASRLEAARRLIDALAVALGDRRIDVVGDSAYAGKTLRGLPDTVTWTTRLACNAALWDLAPAPTGRRGRPRTKGDRLGSLADLAAQGTFAPTTVTRYGRTVTVRTAVIACLWYGVFGPQQIQVLLARDKTNTGYDIALVTTDLTATPAQIIERYADRWSIEVAIEDAKQTTGVGQAPKPRPPSSRTDRPLRAHRRHPHHLLVRNRRPPPQRRRNHPQPRALVPDQNPTIRPRHGRQTPPRHHRRAISTRRPHTTHTSRNQPPTPRMGRRRRLAAKVEVNR